MHDYAEGMTTGEVIVELFELDVDPLLIRNRWSWGTVRELYNEVMEDCFNA